MNHNNISELPLEVINGLKIDYESEKSIKISHDRISRDRYLFVINNAKINGNIQEAFLPVCKKLNMPIPLMELFLDKIVQAPFTAIAYEKGLQASSYKMYLEFSEGAYDRNIIKNRNASRNMEPRTLFIGFKWNPAKNTQYSITKYDWHPLISFDTMKEKIRDLFKDKKNDQIRNLNFDFIDMVSEKTTYDRVIYIDAYDDNNPRHSYDINIYRAKITLNDIKPMLETIFHHYSQPESLLHETLLSDGENLLGNMACGLNKQNKEFTTIYYGMKNTSKVD